MTTKPTHTIVRGSIEAAIWENPSKNGTFFRATVTRRYRAADGTWKNTASFGAKDLGEVALLVIQAQAWMLEHSVGVPADAAIETPGDDEAETR